MVEWYPGNVTLLKQLVGVFDPTSHPGSDADAAYHKPKDHGNHLGAEISEGTCGNQHCPGERHNG
jgi:hypothetical protein